MPCPHYRIKISSRGKKQSAVAQAAYQSGDCLVDERTNHIKNYGKKRGIIHTEILLPENAPREYGDRNTLWNAVEASEKNWNAQLARRIEIALPIELTVQKSAAMIREYCKEQFVSKGMIADIAIHDPDPPGHNPHAHIMLTMRPMDQNGRWMEKAHRAFELDEAGNRIRDADGNWKFKKVCTTDWNDPENAVQWREAWEKIQNRYLEKSGRSERVSMKSYKEQGIDRIPTVHMGPAVTAMERRGIQTDIGNLNREIRKVNRLIATLKKAISEIAGWIVNIWNRRKEIERELPFRELLEERFASYMERNREEVQKMPEEFRYQMIRINEHETAAFENMMDYLRRKEIEDGVGLYSHIVGLEKEQAKIREQLQKTRDSAEKYQVLLKHAYRYPRLDEIHSEYRKIYWKGKKEKFEREHRQELIEWQKSQAYLKDHFGDQEINPDAVIREAETLKKHLKDLDERLKGPEEEIRMLQTVRAYMELLVPEKVPDEEPTVINHRKWKPKYWEDRERCRSEAVERISHVRADRIRKRSRDQMER